MKIPFCFWNFLDVTHASRAVGTHKTHLKRVNMILKADTTLKYHAEELVYISSLKINFNYIKEDPHSLFISIVHISSRVSFELNHSHVCLLKYGTVQRRNKLTTTWPRKLSTVGGLKCEAWKYSRRLFTSFLNNIKTCFLILFTTRRQW